MSDYDPDDYETDGPEEDYEPEIKEVKYHNINIDKYNILIDKIKNKIISLQDEIISGIDRTRSVQEQDIIRYKAMVEVLRSIIQ